MYGFCLMAFYSQVNTIEVRQKKKKKKKKKCVFQVSALKKKLGMVGRHNILFC